MTQSSPGVDPKDTAAIAASDEALRDFTAELNRLHIAFGAPSYAAIAKFSVRPKLTKAGLNEALSGKRLPSLEALLEFVRVVSNPLPPLPDAPATFRASAELRDAWRTRWQQVKFLQRQAQGPWKHVRATAQETLDQALREAEEIRAAAHEEADHIRAEARKEAEAACIEAREEAQRIVQSAQPQDARLRENAERILKEDRYEAAEEQEQAAENTDLVQSPRTPPEEDDDWRASLYDESLTAGAEGVQPQAHPGRPASQGIDELPAWLSPSRPRLPQDARSKKAARERSRAAKDADSARTAPRGFVQRVLIYCGLIEDPDYEFEV
ncbi:DivIVA domain-containing protein [Streptomyces sp. NPDC002889]|uniref:DivIVA domain-containing protein n=1 Tax=Streptomyces sp. NPDC002889 TaxID=3364669 RepID=UPI00369C3C91